MCTLSILYIFAHIAGIVLMCVGDAQEKRSGMISAIAGGVGFAVCAWIGAML